MPVLKFTERWCGRITKIAARHDLTLEQFIQNAVRYYSRFLERRDTSLTEKEAEIARIASGQGARDYWASRTPEELKVISQKRSAVARKRWEKS